MASNKSPVNNRDDDIYDGPISGADDPRPKRPPTKSELYREEIERQQEETRQAIENVDSGNFDFHDYEDDEEEEKPYRQHEPNFLLQPSDIHRLISIIDTHKKLSRKRAAQKVGRYFLFAFGRMQYCYASDATIAAHKRVACSERAVTYAINYLVDAKIIFRRARKPKFKNGKMVGARTISLHNFWKEKIILQRRRNNRGSRA